MKPCKVQPFTAPIPEGQHLWLIQTWMKDKHGRKPFDSGTGKDGWFPLNELRTEFGTEESIRASLEKRLKVDIAREKELGWLLGYEQKHYKYRLRKVEVLEQTFVEL